MIVYKRGDLLQSDCGVIVHGCNCQGKMGTGIAKAIKEAYPNVFDRYTKLIKDYYSYPYEKDLLGTIQAIMTDDNKRCIINAFTQEYYGRDKRYTSYDAVDNCMSAIAKIVPTIKKIGMVKIGCVNAGGHWPVVEAILNLHLKNHTIEIYEL